MSEQIKKFCILNIKMEGFKRFKEAYDINLEQMVYISGGNGQGKTTIADAIAFAFCGTPFWGDRSADKLINAESKTMTVEVRLVDEEGELHTLIRQKTLRDMVIVFDNKPFRQKDLTNKFAEKDIFLSILNPLYFIEKIAEDGREFLQQLLPTVEKHDVLALMSEHTRSLIENESIYDPDVYIANKREELKNVEKDCDYFQGQIDVLKEQQRETAEKIDSVIEHGNSIKVRKNELESKRYSGIDVEALKARQTEIAEILSDVSRDALLKKQAEVQNRQYVSKYTDEIVKVKAEIDRLKRICGDLSERAKKLKCGDKCPTCHTVVTQENYMKIISELRRQYNETVEKGKNLMTEYNNLLELDKKSQSKFEEFRAEDLKSIEAEISALKSADVSEIAMLEDKIRLGNLSEEEYAELTELIKQSEDFAKEVEVLADMDKIPDKILVLEKNIESSNKRKSELEQIIRAVKEYAATKAEISLKQLEMNRASIKLYDVVKGTGEVKNVFRFTYDGKDYRWLSTSEKIKAGLEVSDLLARLTGLEYPTYIDNAECITTKLSAISGQVLLAYARGTELNVHVAKRTAEQMKEAA